MTKSHILIYALTVLGITIGAYLYTSTVEAPHGLTVENDDELILETTLDQPSAPDATPQPVLETETPIAESPIIKADLVGKTWQWSHTENMAGLKTFTPKRGEAFRMQFTAGRISSATDCNTVGGSYTTSGDLLSFGPLMSTLMYCEGSEESIYHASLEAVAAYEATADKLLLKTDNEVMVFTALEL